MVRAVRKNRTEDTKEEAVSRGDLGEKETAENSEQEQQQGQWSNQREKT